MLHNLILASERNRVYTGSLCKFNLWLSKIFLTSGPVKVVKWTSNLSRANSFDSVWVIWRCVSRTTRQARESKMVANSVNDCAGSLENFFRLSLSVVATSCERLPAGLEKIPLQLCRFEKHCCTEGNAGIWRAWRLHRNASRQSQGVVPSWWCFRHWDENQHAWCWEGKLEHHWPLLNQWWELDRVKVVYGFSLFGGLSQNWLRFRKLDVLEEFF